jgi:pro-apoptotic serine protease NMA111
MTSWKKTIDGVAPGIVCLKTNMVRPFDGNGCSNNLATGFVIDAKLGIILTNRHVVTIGPVRGVATFFNKEEVPVRAIYRDPVHDFGFFKFDPSRVRFMDVIDIELFPQGAQIGTEIRVVGNDAGEKLSILSGTIARCDRDAPEYSTTGYNDFNTFYLSAASSTSGGSSGSPVLNIDGKAVAINAGGRVKEATSFYYPLDRIVRALRILQENGVEPTGAITRGTIQTIFKYHPYDETRRLGLPDDFEEIVRKNDADGTGMLVVEKIVPDGPGARAGLEPGDILLYLNNELCTSFTTIEATMDQLVKNANSNSNKKGTMNIVIWRGTTKIELIVEVDDLHALVPKQLLEIGQSAFHKLSYHQAVNFHIKCTGIYVAWAGYMLKRAGISEHVIIDAIGNNILTDLQSAATIFASLPNQKSIPFRFRSLFNQHVQKVKLVKIDRTWFPMSMIMRDDISGLWNEMNLGDTTPTEETPKVQSTTFMTVRRYVFLLSYISYIYFINVVSRILLHKLSPNAHTSRTHHYQDPSEDNYIYF